MFDIESIDHDLKEMKANTLYKYGKKVEIADQMYHQKLNLLSRLIKMVARVRTEQVIKKGWFKKKRQQELLDRLEEKLQRTERIVKKLEEMKIKYMEDFKYQREACGLQDHAFIDEFYKDY